VRRKLPIFVLAVVVALATAGVAAASNGGLTPVHPESPNAQHTLTAYWVVVGFTGVIFFLVEGLLIAFIWKYRSRGRARTVEGPQVHGQTRLEIIWTVIPVVILVVIAAVVFVELPGIDSAPASTNPLHITVEAHQFYWQFDYPDGSRSINRLEVPVGRVVDLKVVATDVIHSWWIPALGGKIQAIPGHVNHTWFMAEDPGVYEGQCAELCGVYHASMTAEVIAAPESSYEGHLRAAAKTIGQQEWGGVCATCHGNLGQGGYGPSIASNTALVQEAGLRQLLHNGAVSTTGPSMPPVGDTWNNAQLQALIRYVKSNIYKGTAPVGGTH
jgi:cytochrome c oxidase subunit 2